MKELDLPPYAPLLMESTRALGYSLEAAIADIIDNSVAAGAIKISIKFIPFNEPYLSILDDGQGMDSDEITSAMRYGSRDPNDNRDDNDLGRFGLGLKTATLSQARKLTVISLKDGEISGRCWDLDYVITSHSWSLLVLDESDIQQYPQVEQLKKQGAGTLVIMQNLDRVCSGEENFQDGFSSKMIQVGEHLSLIFHRYLSGEPGLKRIKMDINGEPIVAHDPFLRPKSQQVMDDEFINIDGQKVLIKPFVLPHVSNLTNEELKLLGDQDGLRKNQGFYVYRNKRLLVWGTWFRLIKQDELSKLARVQVDIPNTLDHLWSIDIRKSTARPPEIVRRNLSRIVGRIAERSKRTWTFRGRKETDDSIIHVWKRMRTREGIRYDINRDHPVIELLKNTLQVEDYKKVEQLLQLVEMTLPLNSLYVDLTNDEKFDKDGGAQLSDEIKELALMLLQRCHGEEERQQFFDRLKTTPPFSQFPDKIIKYLNEVK